MTNLRILIIRIDRIGDVVLSTPLPREIKKAFPEASVSVLVREYTSAIYLNNPFIDRILIYEDYPTALSLVKKIRKEKYNFSFMLLPDEKINWTLFFSGIKNRFGVGHKFYQFITNTKSVFRRKYLDHRHESEYCMDMLRKLNVNPDSLDPEIYLTEDEKDISREIKGKYQNKIAVGINTTSGNSAPNVDVSEYRKVINKLLTNEKILVVVTDLVPPEKIANIEGVLYPNIENTLRHSIINFSTLDYLISASTGPMHIAAALKIPTLALFCPLPATSPDLWGPRGNRAEIILPEPYYCQTKCPGDPKKCNFSGTGGIDADKVIYRLDKFIKK